MNTLNKPELLLSWGSIDHCVSVHGSFDGKGYSSEWWISSKFAYDLQVVGNFNFPIYGATLEEVKQRARFILDDILMFTYKTYGGDGNIANWQLPVPSRREEIAKIHVRSHITLLPKYYANLLERTAMIVKLLEQFGVADVAKVLTDIEELDSVRTAHDRIARARAGGYLPKLPRKKPVAKAKAKPKAKAKA
jgi:hypothetical protein